MKKSGLIILLAGILLATGCAGAQNEEGGTLSVIGSSSVAPLAETESEYFLRVNSEVRIDVQSVGSSAGIKAVADGTAMVGMS